MILEVLYVGTIRAFFSKHSHSSARTSSWTRASGLSSIPGFSQGCSLRKVSGSGSRFRVRALRLWV